MTKQDFISKLQTGKPQLSVGTLTGSMMNQGQEIAILEKSGVNLLHLDVMDGQAWSKITVGAPFLAGLETSLIKDVHLLTLEPEKHVEDFVKAGAGIITFQVEHTEKIQETLQLINDSPALCGVGIYPATSLDLIRPFIDQIDAVTLLSIGPTTGKETSFDVVAERLKTLRTWKPELVITIDGAVKKNNITDIAKLGSDLIATGSAVFDGNDAAQNIAEMRDAIA